MRLIILGAGGYGKTVADIARQSGKYEQIYFLDDGQETSDLILGTCLEYMKFADGNIRRIIDMQEYSRILIEELREALQDLDDFLFGY